MNSPALQPVLHEIADYLDELLRILQTEYSALSDNDIDTMQQMSEAKIHLTQSLEDLEQERCKILKSAGLDLNKTGVMAYLQRHNTPGQNSLHLLWSKIEQLTKACEKQNKINGAVIENNRQRTETALQILNGQENETELYSAAGSRVASRQQKSLAKA